MHLNRREFVAAASGAADGEVRVAGDCDCLFEALEQREGLAEIDVEGDVQAGILGGVLGYDPRRLLEDRQRLGRLAGGKAAPGPGAGRARSAAVWQVT